MKKTILLAATALVFGACNNDELERSNKQRDSLMTVLDQKETDLRDRETSMNEFISSFNDVERNLDSVTSRQQIIYMNSDKKGGDLQLSQKQRINAQIRAINDLMETNRNTIADLKRKLKKSGSKNAKLEKLVATLTEQVSQKDAELAALNQRLNEMNAQVATLTTHVDSLTRLSHTQGQTIADNTIAMHTAYYVIGKRKELEKSRVIDRQGGLLGMGKSSRLSQNVDASRFTKIDFTQTSTIPVNSKGAKVVTSHPADSYRLEKDAEKKNVTTNIVITNPERFWSTSKYLVIEGDPVKSDKSLSTNDNREKEKNY